MITLPKPKFAETSVPVGKSLDDYRDKIIDTLLKQRSVWSLSIHLEFSSIYDIKYMKNKEK